MVDEIICFCFGYSEKDIRDDVIKHGRSIILERITVEKKAGACNCMVTNPKGK